MPAHCSLKHFAASSCNQVESYFFTEKSGGSRDRHQAPELTVLSSNPTARQLFSLTIEEPSSVEMDSIKIYVPVAVSHQYKIKWDLFT